MDSSDYLSGASEIGSLTAHSNDESRFVGSSSGVFFINTVRQAFSKNLGPLDDGSSARDFPAAEDTIVGSEDSPQDNGKPQVASSAPSPSITGDNDSAATRWHYDPAIAAIVGSPPPLKTAKELMMMYFKVWHPLFPFLHGPTFLQAMELLYANGEGHGPGPVHTSAASEHRNACWTTIFQCIFNMASLLRSDVRLPEQSKIKSPASIQLLLGTLTSRHDVHSLQALLAAQLYLVATMALRPASTVGGCILRSMLHGGLHRCPFRYKQLSSHDRHLRKRIFWCAYAIDRYLSQALGLPLGIQDSDIDVCQPGIPETHVPGSHKRRTLSIQSPKGLTSIPEASSPETPLSESMSQAESRNEDSHDPASMGETESNEMSEQQRKREATLASYVESGKLTGRALELFHKSIHTRTIRRESVLFLISDVHKWWNGLPPELQGSPAKMNRGIRWCPAENAFNFGPYFTVLYHHLILLINRPTLALSTVSADFSSGLQTCINAARGILSALRVQYESDQAFFWPGFLSAAWMSGLVLAFACQLGQYVPSKGSQEINECLKFLKVMSQQWETAKHCYSALSSLNNKIKQQRPNDMPSRPAGPLEMQKADTQQPGSDADEVAHKKRKLSAFYSPPLRSTTMPPPLTQGPPGPLQTPSLAAPGLQSPGEMVISPHLAGMGGVEGDLGGLPSSSSSSSRTGQQPTTVFLDESMTSLDARPFSEPGGVILDFNQMLHGVNLDPFFDQYPLSF
ncbi:hypothetical protein ASPZODRAFT_131300 [Penicilliopsis zonata CBS 506.65]|uniref:Xylanolytic transcriptional activator regulatory domain-containing protein n=1 Tax=Penicilliopsis zonata CBS 506.65 TaxID=1073090 RepID=A0A1L9SKV6_9EURO|nr:hypothetical protein ASPZODRAFT_131300 [Penicilliopsis zonata CBS 506.65]OJJ47741.1 hypothetical protein ASPZODRAFT_131300 [Penicilliopsis zonata CBS 506.65]